VCGVKKKKKMAQKDRKIRKLRGTRTCGYGNTQKHRGAGSRGGRGMAGSKKHKWSFISKNFPNYFGRRGFKRPQKILRKEKIKVINLSEIEEKFDKFLKEGKIKKTGKKFELNLKELKYDKLLGKGKITHPLMIIINSYSEKALKKIQEVGGKIESGISETNN
jgi:large subunit ribosomal protein L15